MGGWHLDLGDAEFGLGHFDAAIEEFHMADNTGCCGPAAPLSMAAAYALAGKMDQARSASAEARRRPPKLTAKRLFETAPHLIRMWLDCPVEETDDRGRKTGTTEARDKRRGIPQGSPLSPLLANIYTRRFVLGWSTRRSTIRRATDFKSSAWGMLPKEAATDYPSS